MSKHLKRVLALLLVLVMVLGLFPAIAFAEETDAGSERGLGRRNPEKYQEQVEEAKQSPRKQSTPKTALPASYNSNTLGYITPVRNQGNYGTCWAHGAIASCEAYMIKHGVKVGTGSAATTSLNLSESHLAWFGYSDAYDALGMLTGDKTKAASDYRDLGGFGEIPSYTLMRWEGLASESTSGLSYSSMPKNGLSSSLAYQVNVAHVQDCVWIPTSDRTAVKEAIMEYGAGTFGYYADDGEHEKSDGSYYYPTNESSNHDVTVVGWDDNYSKSKFTSPQPAGNGAWIIKNSWGTGYGSSGYYYISYYDVPSSNDTCYFYKVEDVDNYDNNYQYDGTTNFNNYMQLKHNGSVANVFTANGTETLEAVAFCNWDAGMSYKCDIYKNPTGSNPTSGTLVSTKSGTFEFAGYHTVELDTTVSLSAGDKFSVVFTNTGSSTIDIGLDKTGSSSGWVSWTHSSPSGASYYTNSGSWTDYSGTANLRIKAYTKNGQVVQEPCTITLKAGTTTWRTVNTYTNTSATLPAYTGTVPTGYTFAGWTASTISGTTQSAPTLYNGSYATGSSTAITLYACFSKSESGGGSSTGYRLMTSAPVAGDQIIIAGKNGSSYYAFKTDASTTGVAITVSNNLVTSDPTGLVWEVESGNYGSTSGLTLSDSGYYLHINSSALKVVSNDKNNGIFGFTSTGNNTYSVDGLVNSKYLGFSGTSFSASGSATGLYLFKYGTGSGSTTTYTTTLTTCSHTYAESDRLDATCTDEGTIEYTCSKCGDRYYDDIPALGHNYGAFTSNNNGTHSKTCSRCSDKVTENCSYTSSTSGATTTFTCSVCNYSYSTVLNTYTVSYNVLGSVVNTASCVEGQSVTLPATATAVEGFTFRGWVTAAIDPEITTAPTVLTGSYKPTANTTLYALYTRTEQGTGSGDYVKVTKTSDLTDGQYLIVCEDQNVAFNGGLATLDAVSNTVAVSPANGEIAASAALAAAEFTFTASNGAFLSKSGKYIGRSADSNGLDTGDTAKTNTVTISGGDASIIGAGGAYLRYNAASDQMRFRYYKSSTYTGQQPIQLYKKTAGGSSSTTYYTTAPVYVAPCEHTNTSVVNAAAATCTAAGYTGDTVCDDCGTTIATGTAIAALGHNYGAFTSNNNGTHSKTCSRCSDKVTEDCSYTSSTSGTTVTHTCSVCNYAYTSELNTFEITYSVPAGVSAIAKATVIEGESVTLPTAGTVDGYTFAGWVKTSIADETSTAPTVLTGSYQPTANVTLYALYTRTEAGEGGAAPTSGYAVGNTGSYVIAADVNGTWYALPNAPTLSSGKIDGEVITVSDNNGIKYVTTANAEGYVWTVAKSGSYYTISDGSKSIYHSNGGASGTNLTYGTSANYPWDIYTSSGNILLAGAVKSTSTRGSRGMLVRIDGNTPLFGGYSLSNVSNTDYTNVILLPVSGGSASTTYYTTKPASVTPPHVHDYDASGVCSCGDKLISIDSASLRLDEDIDVIYNVTVPEGATASMTFTMNGETTTVNDNGSHSFLFEGVNPQCMGDNISATLNVTYGGKSYSCAKATYSVKTYCTDMLSKSSTTTQLRKLLSDTLAYGAAAQTYMSYKTNALVTSGVTGTSYSTFTSLSGLNATFTGTAAESPCWIGASLDLSNNVAMVFRFASPNKTGLSVKVTYNGKTTTFSGTSITAVSGMSGVYEVKLTGIKATDFDETVSASFYKSSAQVGNMVSYSVNTYICAKQADNDANLAALVKALYNYGTSAKAYRPA